MQQGMMACPVTTYRTMVELLENRPVSSDPRILYGMFRNDFTEQQREDIYRRLTVVMGDEKESSEVGPPWFTVEWRVTSLATAYERMIIILQPNKETLYHAWSLLKAYIEDPTRERQRDYLIDDYWLEASWQRRLACCMLFHPECPETILEDACLSAYRSPRKYATEHSNCPEAGRVAASLRD